MIIFLICLPNREQKGFLRCWTNAKITLEIYAHFIPNEDNDTADIFEKALEKSL